MRDTSRIGMAVVLTGLAMSVGWGIRGDYGHEAGAMIPGALLGLAICLGSGREDWWRRASIMGMCGAIGWAFGGQMSYGRIIGYTASSSLPDVLYGYACLLVIGGLWAGIGSAVLAMSVTQPASWLERFPRPLAALGLVWLILALSGLADQLTNRWSLHDTDWVGATSALLVGGICALLFPSDRGACGLIAVLASGWWAGYVILVVLLGLHMTPPRSDNWAGCAGLLIALVLYLRRRKDFATIAAGGWGVLIGGLGFVMGDFLNMLGRAQWGPIGRYGILQGLDYWKWMEQSFGLIMGLGVGAVFLMRIGPRTSSVPEDSPGKGLPAVALMLLLPVLLWANLSKNIENWLKQNQIPQAALGLGSTWWFLVIGALLSAVFVVAMIRHHRGRLALSPTGSLGRTQLLFLLILWVFTVGATMQALPELSGRGVFLVHVSFWITAGLCSLFVLLPGDAEAEPGEVQPASANTWRLGRRFWMLLCFVPLLVFVVAILTVAAHQEPLPGSQLRFVDLPASTAP